MNQRYVFSATKALNTNALDSIHTTWGWGPFLAGLCTSFSNDLHLAAMHWTNLKDLNISVRLHLFVVNFLIKPAKLPDSERRFAPSPPRSAWLSPCNLGGRPNDRRPQDGRTR